MPKIFRLLWSLKKLQSFKKDFDNFASKEKFEMIIAIQFINCKFNYIFFEKIDKLIQKNGYLIISADKVI